MSERKLATVRVIDSIVPIEGADKIEKAIVGGWSVVVQKGDYSVNQKVVFFEIDSWIPTELAPFLSKGTPSEFEGVSGERLRTVRLRGQLSQGLILPIEIVVEHFQEEPGIGTDVTEILGINKWERPIPVNMAGAIKGHFPWYIPKTDQERVQNLAYEVGLHHSKDTRFEESEKLNGSSMTVFMDKGEFGVCSRNLQLEIEGNENNIFVRTALHLGLEDKMKEMDLGNFAIQGELVGEGIQGNPYGISGQKFYIYNIYSIDEQTYFEPRFVKYLADEYDLDHVPVLKTGVVLFDTIDEFLYIAEGKSSLNPDVEREGLVFKSEDGVFSFKVVSNRWLLSGGE